VVRVALFDLDNTLVDRQDAYRRWAESFVAERGLETEAVRWLCAADDDGFARREDVFAGVRARWGLAESVEHLLSNYRKSYPSFFAPDNQVSAALDRLRQAGWKIGVVTNGPASQHMKLERAGLVGLVDACCVSDEVGSAKPDRGIFEEALLRCGARSSSKDSVVMVGDTPAPDIGGGRAMGFRTIWIQRGRVWPLTEYAPDTSVGSVVQAVDQLLLD